MDTTNSNLPPVTINIDEISNNAISHKPSIKSYATRVFQESTVGIVSSIFTTHNKYRRFFKVFLSSLCIAGFIYHCVAFLNHVLGYPEVVDIYLDRSETYNWPAYTFCSNNPIRRSVFCDMHPKRCVNASEQFCKKYSSYCGANAKLIPKDIFYEYSPRDYKWILEVGRIPNVLDIDRSITWPSKDVSGPFLRTHRYAVLPCYSIHSRVESNRDPLQKIKRKMRTSDIGETIRFNVNETHMMNPRNDPGVYFSLHSPFDAVNPFEKGFFLKGGRTYDIYFEMQEEIFLKAPFESNCMDYDELWEKNNRTGPRTKWMCEEKCYLEYDLNAQGCTYFIVLYPNEERICGDKSFRNLTPARPVIENPWELYENCLENCRDECRSSKYMTELYIRDQDKKEFVEDDELHGHIEVNIILSNDKVKVLRHSPKYETVDVISSVGGFMGCWLGIALLDILDVFGSIMTIFRYSFRKILNKENKKEQYRIHVY